MSGEWKADPHCSICHGFGYRTSSRDTPYGFWMEMCPRCSAPDRPDGCPRDPGRYPRCLRWCPRSIGA